MDISIYTYEWTQLAGPFVDLAANSTVISTSALSNMLVLLPGCFTPGEEYQFNIRLRSSLRPSSDFVDNKVVLLINGAPRNGQYIYKYVT